MLVSFVKKRPYALLGLFLIISSYILKDFLHIYFTRLMLTFGIASLITELTPTKLKNAIFDYEFNQIIDRWVLKYWKILLFLIVISGFYLRFKNLGILSFWIDELTSVYAAKGLMETGKPLLPSGHEYSRSILHTYLMSHVFRITGINEYSARLLSVLFGSLTIFLIYLTGSRFFNKKVGLLASFFIAFSPFEIIWSREARMYSQLQFFYLLTVGLFYLGYSKKKQIYILLSVFSFFLAFLTERLALTSLASILLFYILEKRYLNNLRTAFALAFGAFITVASTALLFPSTLAKILQFINPPAPEWGIEPIYFYILQSEIRYLIAIFIIGSIILFFTNRTVKLKSNNSFTYFSINFLLPLAILSLADWKSLRYIFYIYPLLILISLFIIDHLVFEKKWTVHLKSMASGNHFRIFISIVLSLLLAIHLLGAVNRIDIPKNAKGVVYKGGIAHPSWKGAGQYILPQLEENELILSTRPQQAYYYLGRVDYKIGNEFLWKNNSEGKPIEIYTGTPAITDISEFMDLTSNSKGWIILEYYSLVPDELDSQWIKHIKSLKFHPVPSDETIEVYSFGIETFE